MDDSRTRCTRSQDSELGSGSDPAPEDHAAAARARRGAAPRTSACGSRCSSRRTRSFARSSASIRRRRRRRSRRSTSSPGRDGSTSTGRALARLQISARSARDGALRSVRRRLVPGELPGGRALRDGSAPSLRAHRRGAGMGSRARASPPTSTSSTTPTCRAATNALLHYLRHGQARGSKIAPSTVERQWLTLTLDERFPNLRPLPCVREHVGTEAHLDGDRQHQQRQPVRRGRHGTDLRHAAGAAHGASAAHHHALGAADSRKLPYRARGQWDSLAGRRRLRLLVARHAGRTACRCRGRAISSSPRPGGRHGRLARRSTPANIIYLVQEDERRFYPEGDESIRCAEVLDDPRITCIVNSKPLLRLSLRRC